MKTEFVTFYAANHNPVPNRNLTVAGVKIHPSNEAKYLGFYLDKHLTYETQIKNVLKKCPWVLKRYKK